MHCASRRRHLFAAVLANVLPLTTLAADWPTRPVTLVVPQGTGSGSDVVARLLAVHMGAALGQSVVVENRTGGGGIIAHQSVARAPADGYTVLLTSTAQLLVVPAMNASAKYTLDDFTPVAPVLRAPFAILVANTPTAPKTVKELTDTIRRQPSAYASAGTGTMTHLGSEIFLRRANLKATHVPYKGSGAALTDLMGGQMLFATDSLTAALTHIRSGKLRALAVTGDKREASLPDVPTLAEAGLPGEPIAVIGGIFAPKGVPRDVAEQLDKAIDTAMRNPDVVQRFAAMETGMLRGGNEAFIAQLRKEAPGWQSLVRQLELKAD